MSIKDYLDRCEKTFSLDHIIAVKQLREYMKVRTDEELIAEIKRLTYLPYFRYLQEAGLRKGIWLHAIDRIEQLQAESQK